jgi:hypothetical protein
VVAERAEALDPDRPLPPGGDHPVCEDTILYEFTIDDPTVYTSVWGGQVPFERLDDRLYEYACHEGNYAIANVLSGARYEEGRAAARR